MTPDQNSSSEGSPVHKQLSPIMLATNDANGYWAESLRSASVNVHVVTKLSEFVTRVEQSPPAVLLLDFSIGKDELMAMRSAIILKNIEMSIFVMALLEEDISKIDERLINVGFKFGAQDFLVRGLPPVVMSHRLRFAYRHASSLQRIRANDPTKLDGLREGQAYWIWDVKTNMVMISDEMRFLLNADSSFRLTDIRRFLSKFSEQQRKAFERAIKKARTDKAPARMFQIFAQGTLKGAVEHIIVSEQSKETGSERVRGVARLREDSEKQRQKLFNVDRLTGLPNQDGLISALNRVLDIQVKDKDRFESGYVGLVVVDIDRFKRIQAAYGQAISEEAVRQIAARLKKFIIEPDQAAVEAAKKGDKALLARAKAIYIACMGRDEFVFLMTGLEKVNETATLAERVIKAFAEPFKLAGNDIFLTASMGITIAPVDGDKSEELIRHARAALTHAKGQPSSGYQFFSPVMASSGREKIELENLLRHAVENDGLEIEYQPQVDIKTGKVVGVEALARWNHPEFGAMSPDAFVAIAEEVGIINDLGEYVLRQSIRDTMAWAQEGVEIDLSVNISAGMFATDTLEDLIDRVLADTKFPANRLTLEVTEGLVMRDMGRAVEIMNALKKKGIQMALDDFGTGYSSLSYLKSLPFDQIKIDRSFIRDMVDHPNGAAMVKAILEIGKSLNISVTAEGVETREQLDQLEAEGCQLYQGYYCTTPLAEQKLLSFVKGVNSA